MRRRRLHRRAPRRRPAAAGAPKHPRRRHQAARRVVPALPGGREPAGSTCRTKSLRAGGAQDAVVVYNLAADMGGMGFIENNKALCMLSRADQHAPADGRARSRGRALLLSRPRPASTTPTSRPCERQRAAEGRGRLPGDAGGRLRLGEAVQRAHVPALPRGLRHARRASRATTTSTARTAPGTAAARRRRPRSAAR